MNSNIFNIDKKTIFIIIVIVIYIVRLGNNTVNHNLKIIEKTSINESDNNNISLLQSYNINILNNSNEKNNSKEINISSTINETTFPQKRKKINITKIGFNQQIYINPYYEDEFKSYHYFLSLKKMPKNLNDSLVKKEINDIFANISNNIGMNITSLNEIYYNIENRFGNELVRFNKLIFYAELIGVKKIILNSDNNLYIKNTIHDEKYNLTIEVRNYADIYNYNYQDYQNMILHMENPMFNQMYTCSNYFPNLFFIFFNLKVENRFGVIKNEILNNLPKVKINENDLYIHIRGGDIFKDNATNSGYASSYAQFPLCFYTKIIDENKFNKIYIISEDKLNPIVNKLLEKYKNVIYNNNTLEQDISYLSHAYNIVGSVSSFIISIIKLNSNLKFYWEYDSYQMMQKIYHLHHSIYDFQRNYTIFRMEPSVVYQQEMYIWARSKIQLDIMINDTCPNKFKIIPP